MTNNGSLITVPRLTKAWEPNVNNGILYYKLEAAIMRYLYIYSNNLGVFVQLGGDPKYAPLTEKMYIKPENMVGQIVDIGDDYVCLDIASDMIDLVWKNIKTCRVGFMYTITDIHDPMSDIQIIKPILYLNPVGNGPGCDIEVAV